MSAHDAHLLLRAFCDELTRCGLRHACTSPGSRSAPLVLALAREPGLRSWSHIDERSAGFFALGLIRATGLPVAVACTSGTAAAELAPAVHEAREARLPLLVLTADRPPELREVGAGQVIDQVKLYGAAAKWFFEVGTHDATAERLRWMRALACRAVWTALDGRPGVVHLNFPLREPLIADAPLPPDDSARPEGRPWLERLGTFARPEPHALERLVSELERRPRGVLVCGRAGHDAGLAAAVAGFAETAGYPVLADALSGARRGELAVASYDALLRAPGFAESHRPELVLRIGDLPTSKPLRQWLASTPAALQVAIAPDGVWADPDSSLSLALAADPATVLAEGTDLLTRGRDDEWVHSWREADDRASAAVVGALGDELSEPAVARTLVEVLPGEATLFIASSMPIRDVETTAPARDDAPRMLSNRGANGIDGTVSAAFGAAAAGGGPVVLLIGDVALAHDVGGLLAGRRLDLAITIVLLNNDGGGIFHFLPVAGEGDVFEEHVATPHGLEFARMAELYGCEHELPADLAGFKDALAAGLGRETTTIVEVRTDRAANRELHRKLFAAAAHSL